MSYAAFCSGTLEHKFVFALLFHFFFYLVFMARKFVELLMNSRQIRISNQLRCGSGERRNIRRFAWDSPHTQIYVDACNTAMPCLGYFFFVALLFLG